MHSSTSSFERMIPPLPWRSLALSAALLTGVATVAWELRVRAWGYVPALNDTTDLWAQQREKVKPDSIVIIGDSRILFDTDLGQWEKLTGRRPIQLALPSANPRPFLHEMALDEHFSGLLVVGLAEISYFRHGDADTEAMSDDARVLSKKGIKVTQAIEEAYQFGFPLDAGKAGRSC